MGNLRRGDKAAAREGFSEVLRLEPGNTAAQEQLDKIGEVVTEGGATAIETPYVPPPPKQPPSAKRRRR